MILLAVTLAFALDHHVVRSGETVERIATRARVDVADLRAINGLEKGDQPAAGTILYLPGDDDPEAAAVVLAQSGSGTATAPGKRAVPLLVAETLVAGTLVCTDTAGFATLRLATAQKTRRHDEITLLGGTCLTLDATWAADEDHASVVSVRTGSVSVRATEGGVGAITVRTDAGVATSDTGGFRVTVEEGAARTEALQGDVSVVGAGGEVAVGKGFGTRVRKGEAPMTPVKLLEPGTPDRPSEDEPLRRPDFRWSAVERALGYRVEISTSPAFDDIVYSQDVGVSPWRPESLFLPFRGSGLWWRVSSFDRTGLLGVPSAARRLTLPPGVGG